MVQIIEENNGRVQAPFVRDELSSLVGCAAEDSSLSLECQVISESGIDAETLAECVQNPVDILCQQILPQAIELVETALSEPDEDARSGNNIVDSNDGSIDSGNADDHPNPNPTSTIEILETGIDSEDITTVTPPSLPAIESPNPGRIISQPAVAPSSPGDSPSLGNPMGAPGTPSGIDLSRPETAGPTISTGGSDGSPAASVKGMTQASPNGAPTTANQGTVPGNPSVVPDSPPVVPVYQPSATRPMTDILTAAPGSPAATPTKKLDTLGQNVALPVVFPDTVPPPATPSQDPIGSALAPSASLAHIPSTSHSPNSSGMPFENPIWDKPPTSGAGIPNTEPTLFQQSAMQGSPSTNLIVNSPTSDYPILSAYISPSSLAGLNNFAASVAAEEEVNQPGPPSMSIPGGNGDATKSSSPEATNGQIDPKSPTTSLRPPTTPAPKAVSFSPNSMAGLYSFAASADAIVQSPSLTKFSPMQLPTVDSTLAATTPVAIQQSMANPTPASTEPMLPQSQDPAGDLASQPTNVPTAEPTNDPTREPTNDPTAEPTNDPTAEPTNDPTAEPTNDPTMQPFSNPTPQPSYVQPDREPTSQPTVALKEGTVEPTKATIHVPVPSKSPTVQPITERPSGSPSGVFSLTASPTMHPTEKTTLGPSETASLPRTSTPSVKTTTMPPADPTISPSPVTATDPALVPSLAPSSTCGNYQYTVQREHVRLCYYLLCQHDEYQVDDYSWQVPQLNFKFNPVKQLWFQFYRLKMQGLPSCQTSILSLLAVESLQQLVSNDFNPKFNPHNVSPIILAHFFGNPQSQSWTHDFFK
ncbi:ECF subfamily RNA polymerase sigma-24 subunit [Seminavis robusta]|uniref:ECF subfamily RNA polymerase sigma-24 subunit n=1 Tax=Seminavis robusta TaxID=568900 RepID=A0A9N8ESK3_9STRA|nr:ECF subfamily RNA polymerase sigma-24 subunit [Seminavis robusta]|eukprot:Sro1559_g282420.1 ECF subfamily RNA polymerase sigma-24 subunit (816) ;mRNA; r:3329-5955